MKSERLLAILMLVLAAGAPHARAQDDTRTVDAGDEQAADEQAVDEQAVDDSAAGDSLTLLDQVVPVATEQPALDSESVGPEAGEPPGFGTLSEEELREELRLAFNNFTDLKDRGVLDEAENVAKQVIEMSIRLTGPTSNDTARALSNLGLIQHLNENYEAAAQNFESSIEIIEDNEDRLNSMLIDPLKGLGAAQLANGRPDLASQSFQRAVHISHVNEGPHNLDQVDILQSLAETNLQLGDLEEAKNNQDMIYSLNLRYYSDNAMNMVPSLMRRAKWQRRTGYILDERATYRRVIRIIESTQGKDDVLLVEPLLELGQSYFFQDVSDPQAQFQTTNMASGELYFKRAVRIAEENPEADWRVEARTKLALGDYYNFRSETGRARRSYREAWEILSAGEDGQRLRARREELERPILLNQDGIPRYVGSATPSDRAAGDPDIREGRIVASFYVNTRGRVSGLKIVEAAPEEFEDLRQMVQRELRTRVYRPRFVEAEAAESEEQMFTHSFYYLQPDLVAMQAELAAGDR